MSSPLSSPELVVLSDSESSAEDEERETTVQGTGNLRKPQEVSSSQAPPPSVQRPQIEMPNSNQFFKEMFEIVNWVNTGVKRTGVCEKTFMEKQCEKMERSLQKSEQELEQAQLEICVLKQIKSAMESENSALKLELEAAQKENAELNEKWMQVKEAFQTLHSQYFSDVPQSENESGEDNLENVKNDDDADEEDHQSSVMLHQIKEEQMEVEMQVDYGDDESQMELLDMPSLNTVQAPVDPQAEDISTLSSSESAILKPTEEPEESEKLDELLIKTTTVDTVVPAQKKRNIGIPVIVSSQRGLPTNRGNCGQDKPHGVDPSSEGCACLCGLQFSAKRTLDSHIIYFTCEKKFTCGICNKKFVGSNYLKGHMLRSHKMVYTGGSNGCRDCGETFTTLLELRQHKKTVHMATAGNDNVKVVSKTTSEYGTAPESVKSKHGRRSIRMCGRHLKENGGNNALKMLQGNCNNCQFCREQQKKKQKLGLHREKNNKTSLVTSSSILAAATLNVALSPSVSTATNIPLTRNAARGITVSRSSSSESFSFSCGFCQKWFGDDKSGLIKHQQNCQRQG